MANTIVAGNQVRFAVLGPDISRLAAVTSGGHNLIGDADTSSGWVGTDRIGTAAAPLDPLLAPLGDYGGPTPTFALLPGSPALDAGDSTALGLPATDQRGFARISGAAVDIGAFEVQAPSISHATMPNGTYGSAYSQSLTATEAGYTGSFTFAVTIGSLPAGLSLASDGTLSGTPTTFGSSTFTVTATDSAGFSASQGYALTIDKAALTITPAGGQSKVYGATVPPLSFSASGFVNGDGPALLTGALGTAATTASPVGSYGFDPSTLAAGSNYKVVLAADPPTFAVTPATLTVTAYDVARFYGAANPALTAGLSGFVLGQTLATSGVSGSPSLSTTATAASAPNTYPIAAGPGSLAATNYTFTFVNGTLTVGAAPLSAAAVTVSATAGAPFSGAVATFTTPDKIDGAAAFTAVITWGDGSTSSGVISGSNGSFTVSGSHTYAAAGSDAVSVQITHKLGYTISATTSGSATVSSLGQGVVKGLTGTIGFWQNTGQALIKSFNGGSSSTALSAWLAAAFPNLYGASAGANNLTGKTNAQVAAFYLSQFALPGTKVEAQVLATALSVYASTVSLGGTAGTTYGFSVSAAGLGARSYGVGSNGAAFGVANNTGCNVYRLLQAVNQKAVKGVLYLGNATLRKQAAALFAALNDAGSIS